MASAVRGLRGARCGYIRRHHRDEDFIVGDASGRSEPPHGARPQLSIRPSDPSLDGSDRIHHFCPFLSDWQAEGHDSARSCPAGPGTAEGDDALGDAAQTEAAPGDDQSVAASPDDHDRVDAEPGDVHTVDEDPASSTGKAITASKPGNAARAGNPARVFTR
jgi:hypothetical protein